jgi:hypothetical protein
MTKEALKLALEALQFSGNIWHMDCKKDEAITAIKKALAQPEQEPIAVWELQDDGWDTICDGDWLQALPVGTKLYTTPPQRIWVDLTDEQIADYLGDEYHDMSESELRVFRLGEAAAKEKNT